nr:uncharacterized protein LOC113808125 [Penaeus vannamei]
MYINPYWITHQLMIAFSRKVQKCCIETKIYQLMNNLCNGMKSPNIPTHELKLRAGCVMMVIRNMNPPKTCNGTRLIVTNLRKNIIVGNTLGGVCDGKQVIISRVTLISTDTPGSWTTSSWASF